jgi:hypothetical protein
MLLKPMITDFVFLPYFTLRFLCSLRFMMVISCTILNKSWAGGQDAQPPLPTRKITLCGTDILPVKRLN